MFDLMWMTLRLFLQTESASGMLCVWTGRHSYAQAESRYWKNSGGKASTVLKVTCYNVVRYLIFHLYSGYYHYLSKSFPLTLQDSYSCMHLDTKQKTRCQECMSCCCYYLVGQLCQRNTDSLVRCKSFVFRFV